MWLTIRPQDLLKIVAEFYGLTPFVLRSRSRYAEIVRARWAFIVLCRDKKRTSFSEIGRVLNKHHTTCISGYKQGIISCGMDPLFEQELSFIDAMITHNPASYSTAIRMH